MLDYYSGDGDFESLDQSKAGVGKIDSTAHYLIIPTMDKIQSMLNNLDISAFSRWSGAGRCMKSHHSISTHTAPCLDRRQPIQKPNSKVEDRLDYLDSGATEQCF